MDRITDLTPEAGYHQMRESTPSGADVQSHLYVLTPEDEGIIEEVLPLYLAINKKSGKHTGMTPDELLAEHGVVWEEDKERWYRILEELITRAKEDQ